MESGRPRPKIHRKTRAVRNIALRRGLRDASRDYIPLEIHEPALFPDYYIEGQKIGASTASKKNQAIQFELNRKEVPYKSGLRHMMSSKPPEHPLRRRQTHLQKKKNTSDHLMSDGRRKYPRRMPLLSSRAPVVSHDIRSKEREEVRQTVSVTADQLNNMKKKWGRQRKF